MPARSPSRSIIPLIFIALGVILLAGAGIWYWSAGQNETPAGTPEVRIPNPEISRVSLADAKAAYDTGTGVFLDVRGDPYYSQGHIPGALNISLDDLPNRLNELNPNDWIIPYCT